MNALTRILKLIALLGSAAQLSLSQSTAVTVSPSSPIVRMPDPFSLDITISSVTNLHAANFVIVYRNDILQCKSVNIGPFLPGSFMPGYHVSSGPVYDTLTAGQAILGAGSASGSGTLLTIQFTPKSIGFSDIMLSVVDLRAFPNEAIPCSATNGFVTVDPPLPITLASFIATATGSGGTLLRWTTLSETNNFGFTVQRRGASDPAFADLPNSFVAGHGTTVDRHEYSFADATPSPGTWYYRLKQVDLGGAEHFTDPVSIAITTGVDDQASPTVFQLAQNYPNPFNPTTLVEYQVASPTRVSIEVYNILGERVAVLVDEVREAGYYKATWNGTNANGATVGTGIYFCRMQAGSFTSVKKMMLMK